MGQVSSSLQFHVPLLLKGTARLSCLCCSVVGVCLLPADKLSMHLERGFSMHLHHEVSLVQRTALCGCTLSGTADGQPFLIPLQTAAWARGSVQAGGAAAYTDAAAAPADRRWRFCCAGAYAAAAPEPGVLTGVAFGCVGSGLQLGLLVC